MQAVEVAIFCRRRFIPAITDGHIVYDTERTFLSLSLRLGGLGLKEVLAGTAQFTMQLIKKPNPQYANKRWQDEIQSNQNENKDNNQHSTLCMKR